MRQSSSITPASLMSPLTLAYTNRITELERNLGATQRDLEASRLREQRMRDEVEGLKMALGGAQTLIAVGPDEADRCST
jgi:hypothetical protein